VTEENHVKKNSKKKPTKKQSELKGFERPTTPAVEEAAELLHDIRTKWLDYGRQMQAGEAKLVDVMTTEKVSLYEMDFDGETYVVKLAPTKQKVSIRKKKAPTTKGEA
jgi:hypothetical protein